MGKRAGRYRGPKQGAKKVKAEWSNTTIPQENELFRAYYQLQLGLSKEEFEVFWQMMKEKLPVVFRVNPSTPNFAAFRDKLQHPNFLESMVEKGEEGENEPKEVPRLQVLPWYPGNILHQINTNKQEFKKSKTLSNLHKYLQKAFDAGLIARQELVSMLPPLFLDVGEDDIVLDMCAAPGSKTSQLLEMMYGEGKALRRGCVIANDADYSRAQMLIHQINRSGTAGMAVINHPGQFMPELYSHKINHIKQKFQFDKILCDVPCSGDGATRKIPLKWAHWHTKDGLTLHPLQLSILMKSINLLKRGGLIVYSTCSLNPIENEAVLAALFSKVTKGLQIIDIHQWYGFKSRRGMLHWEVCGTETVTKKVEVNGKTIDEKTRKVRVFKSHEEIGNNFKIKPYMFPPSLEDAKHIGLDKTMRLMPHDQNTGGFFVALLKKHENFEWRYGKVKEGEEEDGREEEFLKSNLPEVEQAVANEDQLQGKKAEGNEQEEEESENEEKLEVEEKPERVSGGMKQEQMVEEALQKIKIQQGGNKEEIKKKKESLKYEKFEPMEESEWQSVQKFFGLDPYLRNLLYVRYVGDSAQKKVLLVSEGVQRFLQADKAKKIKLVNMGCIVFQKGKESFAGNECLYRLSQEGIHFILPHMKLRKIRVSLEFFKEMLSIPSITHEKIPDAKVREQIEGISQGSFCLFIDEEIGGRRVVDAMVGQNFRNSLHLMVGKQELASFSLRYE